MWQIRVDDLTAPETLALVREHLAQMHGQSPACSVHALGVDALHAPGVTLYTAWHEGRLGGMAALQRLDRQNAELKSMRTSVDARGTGLGRILLRHLVEVARADGVEALWLETGSDAAFAAARGLYLSEGFAECPPFGSYAPDPLSVFMTRRI